MQGDLMEKKVMFAVKQYRMNKSIGGYCGTTVAFRAAGFHRRWAPSLQGVSVGQDVRLRNATIREMYRLNDDYLDDMGIKRRDIRPIVDAMMKRLRERRHQSRCF